MSGRAVLFEDAGELDGFFKDAVNLLMERTGAEVVALFAHDSDSQQLVLRAGFDRNEFWDRWRCSGKILPKTLKLDDNAAGHAFTDGRVIRLVHQGEGEEASYAKILVPIARGPIHVGVIMLASTNLEAFQDEDQGDLLAAAAQFADVMGDASSLVSRESRKKETGEKSVIKGKKASEGLAEGRALPFWADINAVAESLGPPGTQDEELAAFEMAVERSRSQLEEFRDAAPGGDAEMVSLIFTAQILMLGDPSFVDAMRRLIREGQSARQAVIAVVTDYATRFSQMTEARLAEKAQDVRDLGFRMVTNLASDVESFSYSGRLVLARHIYPSDLYRLALEGAAGTVLMGAGVTAHIAILARSLKIPVLITDDKDLLDIAEDTPLLLDTDAGLLYINPEPEIFHQASERLRIMGDELTSYTVRGRTADGTFVKVEANVNLLVDAEEAVSQGAEGIGLYRSEFPFILKNDFLSEEQQYRIYRPIVATQSGKPVTLRTADIGGDKLLQGRSESEANPFLGVRGIRFSLANPQMFRDQIRAMLRAGEGADLGIMLPMVSGVEEVIEAKEMIAAAIRDLAQRGVPHNAHPRIGAMVELPSAAMAVEELAAETDFLSIGTNDLVMYLLAVDRTNDSLSHLYRSHHPTVLKTLATIARDAGEKRENVSVCGDVAADPVMAPFLVGLGIRKLSVAPSKVETLKLHLSRFTLKETETLAGELLDIRRLDAMEDYLDRFRSRYGHAA